MSAARTIIRMGLNVTGFLTMYISGSTMYVPGIFFGAGLMMTYLATPVCYDPKKNGQRF